MANENIQDIKAKVRSLLMKAADAVATPAEAEGAMRAAQKLMAKYQVSEKDLGSLTQEDFKEASRTGGIYKSKTYLHPIDRYCSVIVGKFCGVQPWIHNNDEGECMKMLGLEADVELATWMLSAFREQFEADWLKYKRFDMASKRFKDLTAARVSFVHGFARAINDRLQDWLYRDSPKEGSAESDGRALVIKKHDLVQAEMERRGLHLGRGTRRGAVNADTTAAGAGYNSGKAADVGRATAGGAGPIMIGGR